MADRLTTERRSWLMSRIGGKNTTPEMRVRKAAHAMGFRYRLHRKDLPGTPDLVFPKKKLALMVHGCFWHRHQDCQKASLPKTRVDFWQGKFDANVERDKRVQLELELQGWHVETVWECQTKDRLALDARLHQILSSHD